MFRSKNIFKSSGEVANIMRRMLVEVRDPFDQIESLFMLLLDILVSSAEAERSFCALGSLKTRLITTMTHGTIYAQCCCVFVHQANVDKIDMKQKCLQFISVNHRHTNVFGFFK